MDIPTNFEPLVVTDYEGVWDSAEGYPLTDGETFEHVHYNLPNGYLVSVARTNLQGDNSIGYESGLWEAALMRQADPFYTMITGRYGVDAPELDHLTTDDLGGIKVVGNLDNAGVNTLLATVAAMPQAPASEDPFASIFAGLETSEVDASADE